MVLLHPNVGSCCSAYCPFKECTESNQGGKLKLRRALHSTPGAHSNNVPLMFPASSFYFQNEYLFHFQLPVASHVILAIIVNNWCTRLCVTRTKGNAIKRHCLGLGNKVPPPFFCWLNVYISRRII